MMPQVISEQGRRAHESSGGNALGGLNVASDCPEALARLQEYLDGEMEEWQIAEISAHLAACYPCGDRAEFERHLRTVVRVHAAELAPEGLLEKVRTCCRNEASRH